MVEEFTAKDHLEFGETHLQALKRYVVIIAHKNKKGQECIGSGVSVCIGGKHLVATARHCVERDPRLLPDKGGWLINDRFHVPRWPGIVDRRWHDTLDIAFVELESACDLELQEGHLSSERILRGSVYVIGHPIKQVHKFPERQELHISRCCIGIKPLEQTADVLKFDYEAEGVRQMSEIEWRTEPVPDAPGLSGGGIFGVANPSTGGILSIQYKLFGIQYEWHEGERWINAVPIKPWVDLVKEYYHL